MSTAKLLGSRIAQDDLVEHSWKIWDEADLSRDEAYTRADAICAKLRNTSHHQAFGWAALTCGRIEAYRRNLGPSEALLCEALGRLLYCEDVYGSVLAEAHLALAEVERQHLKHALELSLKPWSSNLNFVAGDANLLHNITSFVYWAMEDHHPALLHLRKAYDLVGGEGLLHRRCVTAANIGACLVQMGEPELAFPMLREALEIEQRSCQERRPHSSCVANVICCLLDLDRAEESREYARLIKDTIIENPTLCVPIFLHTICESYSRTGDVETAKWCLEKQREYAMPDSTGSSAALDRMSVALILEAQGCDSESLTIAKGLLSTDTTPVSVKRTAARILSRLSQRRGQHAESRKWKRFASECGREKILNELVISPVRERSSFTPSSPLTDQEMICLSLSAKGQTSSDIALKLGIKPRTVNFHFSKVLRKLNAMNRQEAIAKAVSGNLLREI